MSGAPARRQAVRELIAAGLSQTRACAALATSRSSLAYVPRARHEEALVAAIKAACKRKPRRGYKRVHAQLRREGHPVNRKRILRLWRELGYTLPARRPRKRLRSGESVPGKAEHANHVWTYDFERHEALENRAAVKARGRRCIAGQQKICLPKGRYRWLVMAIDRTGNAQVSVGRNMLVVQ